MNKKIETLDDLFAIPEDERTEEDNLFLKVVVCYLQADQATKNEVMAMLR